METASIILAMSNDILTNKLKTMLAENGYTVVEQARDGHECLRKMRALKPDLTILDYSIALMNGYEVSKVAIEDRICDVMLIIAPGQEGLIGNMKSEGSFVCMTKPINKSSFVNTIGLMLKNTKRVRKLEKEIEELRASLDTRKEVEKAKGLLMKNLGLSEADAFKRIQKQSMDRGIPMKDIARAIILAYDI